MRKSPANCSAEVPREARRRAGLGLSFARRRARCSRPDRGQLRGIRNMIEERRYCVDILTQTRAPMPRFRRVRAEHPRGPPAHLRAGAR